MNDMSKYLTLFRTRLLAVVAACLMAVVPALAETHYKPHINVGFHGGMTMGRMSFAPSVSQDWLNGYTAGVHVSYSEEKLFGLIGEVNLTQRGWKERFKDLEEPEYQRALTYVSIPVMTHIYFGPKRCKFFFNLGPELSFMIGDKITSNFDYKDPHSGTGIPHSRHCEQMYMDIQHKIDYGITAGLGCEFWVSPRNAVYVEARYYYGLGSIFRDSKADVFSASRGMSLAITAGYSFRVK